MPNITQSQNVEDGFWTQVHLAVEHKLLVITLYLADFFFFLRRASMKNLQLTSYLIVKV